MVITRVDPVSCAKVVGLLYAALGLVFGAMFSFFSVVMGSLVPDAPQPPLFGVLFGIGAILVMPIFYGVLGFVTTLIGAWLYNLAAGVVGGVEIEVK
ncbi:MAG: hypothetical protein KJ061_16170 [Vicinamibacteraceae bacterium]|nr:hypothetical protein [Vicinamibacteraceae bacterium]